MKKQPTDAQRMCEVRQRLGLTQEGMAKEMGYGTRIAIAEVEAGTKKMSGPARKLLAVLARRKPKR